LKELHLFEGIRARKNLTEHTADKVYLLQSEISELKSQNELLAKELSSLRRDVMSRIERVIDATKADDKAIIAQPESAPWRGASRKIDLDDRNRPPSKSGKNRPH
jgi:FtsZ-binding cell division protein ZapB